MTGELESERVVMSSYMSFSGSLVRIWRLTEISAAENPWARAGIIAGVVVLIASAWTVIICWYMVALFFWPFLLVVRLVGRHQRKERADQLRHREMLEALDMSGGNRAMPEARSATTE